MANDRMRPEEQYRVPDEGRPSDMRDERVRKPGGGEDIRGIADEEEDFEDMDDLEEDDEDRDSSF